MTVSTVLRSWNLFYASNFCSLLRPCFFLCRLFGCFPFHISKSVFTTSLLGLIYSSIITIAFIGYSFFVIYQIDVSGDIDYKNVPGRLQHTCYMLAGITIAFISYILSIKRMQVLQDIENVSSLLPAEVFEKSAKYIHSKDILGFALLLCLTANLRANTIYELLAKITALFSTLLVCIMDTLYINCVYTINKCFQYVNVKLKAIKEGMLKDDIHILRKNYHEQNNPLILMKLRNVMKAYHHISNVLQRVNSVFAAQIVTTVTLTFIEVTFSLYFFILRNWGNEDITANTKRQIWIQYFIASFSYYSIKLIMIVWVCQKTKEEAREIGIQIHETLINTTDKEIKYELFSLQVLHRDNTMSAKALTVDATLLTTIVGGITTYLLILIQFLIADNDSEKEEENS